MQRNTRFPFGLCVTWNPGGDASWWKGTRRWYSSSHSLFILEETWSKRQQDRSSCWLLLMFCTLNNVSHSCSNPAEYYPWFTLNIIILVQLWVAGEGPTIEWSYLPRKIVLQKRIRILPRSWRLFLIVVKVITCFASRCWGKPFPPSSNVWRH